MKKNCKIVQDLLPNYIENVTSEETNNYIEEHLKDCDECKQVYSSMKDNMNIPKIETMKEVKYMKKFNRKFKILKILLIFILIIGIFIIGRKTVIMTILFNKANDNNKNYMSNYHMKSITYTNNQIISSETYCKDNIHKSFAQKGFLGEVEEEIICYEKDSIKINLLQSGDLKIKSSNIVEIYNMPSTYESTFLSNLRDAFMVNIESVNMKDKECYVIKYKSCDKFFDKETGLIIKEVDYGNNTVTDYTYEFGVVKDSDVLEPDTTGYAEK